jgi:tetratricopeptide (TPR) repeat protein
MAKRSASTPAELEGELAAAMRNAVDDPQRATRRFEELRKIALRRKWGALATSCLVQMRLAVGAYGAWEQELQIVQRLLREDPKPRYWFWLGQAWERNGRPNRAMEAYGTAIALAEKTDHDKEWYIQSIERTDRLRALIQCPTPAILAKRN